MKCYGLSYLFCSWFGNGESLGKSRYHKVYRASGPSDTLQRIVNHMIDFGVRVYVGGKWYIGRTKIITDVNFSDETLTGENLQGKPGLSREQSLLNVKWAYRDKGVVEWLPYS